MSVREMTLGKLIMGTSGLVEGLPSREAVIELDRRERELLDRVAKLEAAQEVTTGDVTVKSFNDLMKLAGEPRDIPVLREALRKPSRADYMFKETGSRVAQEKARAESTGKGEWTRLGELKPGDVFAIETFGAMENAIAIGLRPFNSDRFYLCTGVGVPGYAKPDKRVRKLHVLKPGEIAVRVDEATVDRVAKQVFAHGIPFERSGIIAREILELLRAESKGGGWK